jgi:hypothetical protein
MSFSNQQQKASAYSDSVFDLSRVKRQWAILPKSMIVIEFCGSGDPFFGGAVEDRPLGLDGKILHRPIDHAKIALFETIEQAHQAAIAIPNRRENSIVGVAPTSS